MGMIPAALRRWVAAGYTALKITDRPTTDVSGWGLLYIDKLTRKVRVYDRLGGDRTLEQAAGGGSGDVVGPSASVASEVALYDGTTGKLIKRATTTGIAKLTSGVLSAASAGTDYYAPGGTDVAVADGGTGSSTAAGARTNLGLGTMAVEAVTLSTQGDILYRDGSGLARLAAGTAGQRLRTGGSGANPAWSDLAGMYGDGSDGSLDFDGAATVLGLVPAANVYTMTRDIFATDLRVRSGVRIITASYGVWVNGTLTFDSGTAFISANGADGSGSTAGGAGVAGSYGLASVAGGAGRTASTGAGSNGSITSPSMGGAGGGGGSGGGGGGGGTGGTAGVPSALRGGWRQIGFLLMRCRFFDSTGFVAIQAGSGGGGGGLVRVAGSGAGGGGGGGARAVVVFARHVSGAGYIEANGGAGANSTAAGGDAGGGGGGGGGGFAALVTSTPSPPCTVRALGGTAGNGAGGGANGVAGSAGNTLTLIL